MAHPNSALPRSAQSLRPASAEPMGSPKRMAALPGAITRLCRDCERLVLAAAFRKLPQHVRKLRL